METKFSLSYYIHITFKKDKITELYLVLKEQYLLCKYNSLILCIPRMHCEGWMCQEVECLLSILSWCTDVKRQHDHSNTYNGKT